MDQGCCGECAFWLPTVSSAVRFVWGVCRVDGLRHKWTSPCTVFDCERRAVVNNVIYVKDWGNDEATLESQASCQNPDV